VRTAIVTGREYRDIKKRLGKMPGMYISSNHGYEVWKDGERIFITGTQFRKTFLNLGHDALSTVGGVRGVVIEVKKYSVALHYRMVAAPRQKDVTKRFLQVVKSYSREFSLEVMRGKKLIEVRPKGFWDKGRAVRWMSEKIFPEGLIFYFGDDTTDEDAFAAIGKKGVSVYIGGVKKSRARYRVFRIDQVLPLIEWIQREF
jgi:trehalose 6-phosphate phosphatase